MGKYRILFLHTEFPGGGAERVTMDIASCISNYEFEVYVLAKEIRNATFSDLTIIELSDKTDMNSKTNADAIIHFLNELKIDIFVLPVQALQHLGYIKDNTNCKIVFSLHSAPFWEITADLNRKKKDSGISFFKRLEWLVLTYPKTMWLKKYHKRLIADYRRVYELVDAYTVLTEGYKSVLIDRMKLSADENKLYAIPNSEKEVSDINLIKKKQVLYVGRMNYVDKRVDRLIDIWGMIYKKVPEWELILVGDGSELESLQLRTRKKKIERVNFVGYCDRVEEYYRDASVLCLTSSFEGWPLCLTEAQANGVVPIAFDSVSGIHEILSPSGVNGILVPPFDMKKYARLLLGLLKESERTQKMRRNVISKSKEYAPEVIGEKWLSLFRSLLSMSPSNIGI